MTDKCQCGKRLWQVPMRWMTYKCIHVYVVTTDKCIYVVKDCDKCLCGKWIISANVVNDCHKCLCDKPGKFGYSFIFNISLRVKKMPPPPQILACKKPKYACLLLARNEWRKKIVFKKIPTTSNISQKYPKTKIIII